MNSDINTLLNVLKAFTEGGVKYVICGGVACVLHGVERATYDIDLSVSLETKNLENIIRITKKFNLVPRIPEPAENLLSPEARNRWVKEKNALVYTFLSKNSPLQIDIFLSYPKSFDELLENADIITVDNIDIVVSSKEDLIFAKNMILEKRDKDITDIRELKKLLDEERKEDKEN